MNENRIFRRTDLVLIQSEYEEILVHDVPILFTGRNSAFQRVVGSFVETLSDVDVYLHSIVDEKVYGRFENQLITYSDLLRDASFLFNVRYDDSGEATAYWINFDEIPIDYVPTEEAVFPASTVKKSTVAIEAKFTGGLSENHLLKPETASSFQVDCANLFRKIFQLEGFKNLSSNVLLDARKNDQLLQRGSVRFNYQIRLQEKTPTLFFDATTVAPFIEFYVVYCLNHLSGDAPALANSEWSNLPHFQALVSNYVNTFKSSDRAREEKLLAKNVLVAAKKLGDLTELMGPDVKKIEFNSLFEEDPMRTLGVFDGETASSVEESLERIDAIEGKAWVKEENVTEHEIHIYQLNVDTRGGRAILPAGKGEKVVKPLISIGGDQQLDHTKYSGSLHESKMITVKARVTRSAGEIRKLDIEFEDDD